VLLISHSVFLHWKVKGVEEQLALFTSVLDNQDVSSSNKSRFDSQLLTPLLRRKRADLDGNEIGSSSSSSSSLCSCPSGNKLIQEMIHYKQMRMYSIYYIKCIYRAFQWNALYTTTSLLHLIEQLNSLFVEFTNGNISMETMVFRKLSLRAGGILWERVRLG
jgi:hypothetical protein